jgi:hypothetical protein
MDLALAGLILIPASTGALAAMLPRRLPRAAWYFISLAAACIAGGCGLALLPLTGQTPSMSIEWLPGTGPMGFDLGSTGLYAAVITAWACVLALIAPVFTKHPYPVHSVAAALCALGAASIAFLADHFLLRYVALEIVALAIALAPLIELGGTKGSPQARTVYLILRIGDAALLTAIALLAGASGTFEIAPALQVGQTLEGPQVGWISAGLILAVWIKIGGWPFQLWSHAGQQLSRLSRSWLYAIVMPNLGLYLLYKVTPLLSRAGPTAMACAWVGAAGGALGAFLTLTLSSSRSSAAYLGVALGGLALIAAAAGLGTVVWLTLLVVTPLRLLISLCADQEPVRGMVGCLMVLSGGALTAWGGACTYWSRSAGMSLDVLLVAEIGVALLGLWTARRAWQMLTELFGEIQWRIVGTVVLGAGGVALVLGLGLILPSLVDTGHGSLPAPLTVGALARYMASTPSTWIVLGAGGVLWLLRWQPKSIASPPAYNLEQGLSQAAAILRDVVESGLQEQIIGTVVRITVQGAALLHHLIEGRLLEGMLRSVAGAAGGAARFAHYAVEQQSLERLLWRLVRGALGFARALQRLHTGRLRRNLLWALAAMALIMLVVFLGW